MTGKAVKVTEERKYSAHHAYLRIAKHALRSAENQERGWQDNILTAIAFSALSIEAICNLVGELALSDWEDYESCNPRAKVRVLCKHLDVEHSHLNEPWATVLWLTNLRNRIAHPKSEDIAVSSSIPSHLYDRDQHRNEPQSKLEKQFTLKNAQRAVDGVASFLKVLHEALPEDKRIGVLNEMWFWSTEAE